MVSHPRRPVALLVVLVLLTALGAAGAPRADAAPSAEVTSLFNYGFDKSQGSGNVSNLVADGQGVLYGTTYSGGAFGYGTVFAMTPPGAGETEWTHTVLHSFCAHASCTDGSYPRTGLVFAEQPNGITALFATTYEGGDNGYGTIFRLAPPTGGSSTWTHTKLYSFAGDGSGDGAYPLGRLVVDDSGPLVLYGTTYEGGTGDCFSGCGTVYALTPPDPSHPDHWEETVLHSFDSGSSSDGTYPRAGVAFDNQGALYGTTYEGGASGYGAIFQLLPPAAGSTAWTETVLYSFTGTSDGTYPMAGLLLEPSSGSFYGTTAYGGANCDTNDDTCGTVFKLVPPDKLIPSWTLSTLHSFDVDTNSDAQHPVGDLIFGDDGAIYGTSEYGGTPVGDADGPCDLLLSCGTLFRLTGQQLDWDLRVIYKFCSADTGCPVGAQPTAGLTAVGGKLYGTTSYDGEGYACDCGTIFTLGYPSDEALPPLPPPDPTAPLDADVAPLDPAAAMPAVAPLAVVVTPSFTG